MKVETKFNIGDAVWIMKYDGPVSGEIINLQVFVFNDSDIQIRYNISGCSEAVNEKFCFSTKEEMSA